MIKMETLFGADGKECEIKFSLEIYGALGETGIKCVNHMADEVEKLKTLETFEEIERIEYEICGYALWLVDDKFVDFLERVESTQKVQTNL